MSWNDLLEVKIGDIGENLVRNMLKDDGWILYMVDDVDKPHAFDNMAVRYKEEMMIVEIKTKRCRGEYPDTGIDRDDYYTYKKLSEKHNLPVYIYFVDHYLGEIYGNFLDVLEVERTIDERNLYYPRNEGGIVYFPLVEMEHIRFLTNKEIDEILQYA